MREIYVGMGTCGISAGADKVYKKIQELLDAGDYGDIPLQETGCIGMCYAEPLVEIREDDKSYLYGDIDEDRAELLIKSHIGEEKKIDEWLIRGAEIGTEHDKFYDRQKRIVLRNCGCINPNSIEDYIDADGYDALKKVLKEHSPDDVIKTITESGLRGRGGGGFPTGLKWKFAKNNEADKKFVICNADEGDPGAFMDRSTLEGDPHSVLEGMAICGYAIGADEAYMYVRAEYPRAVKRLQLAIEHAEDRNLLGKNILGTDFSFTIHIKEGAGAFVCGEETALMASVEGERGMPKFRPPFPAEKGLWGKPTNINNVETYANVPWIILNGSESFSEMGFGKSRGTKVFALAGKVKRGGLVEVPMGITINDIVFEICGGIRENKKFKAVQMGGPSGGCIPAEKCDIQIDYEQITATGAIMGSGGLVVMDESTCMVEVARFFLDFTQKESCGKCVFCRVGTKRMLEILTRITEGNGREGDIDLLLDLGHKIKASSLCGLGQTAPNPVLTTIKYFRDEYEAHIIDKKCPAMVCSALIKYTVDPENCVGCTACAKACPVDAISGEPKKVHEVDQDICIHCGKCYQTCNFDAIKRE